MYQYTNKNGETFGISHTESSTMAYISGNYVAQAEIKSKIIQNQFSHVNIEKTLGYVGIM